MSSALISAKETTSALVSRTASIPSAKAIPSAAPIPTALSQPAESLSQTLRAPSSFLQRRIFARLPLTVAESRLKINLFILALIGFARGVFTPYIQLRRGLVWAVDEGLALATAGSAGSAGTGRRSAAYGEQGVWWIETIVTLITLWNIAEAYLSVQSPLTPPQPGSTNPSGGLVLTPSRLSSPLVSSSSRASAGSPRKHISEACCSAHLDGASSHPSENSLKIANATSMELSFQTRPYPSSPSTSSSRPTSSQYGQTKPNGQSQAKTSTYQPSAQTPTRSSQLATYPTQSQSQFQPLRSGSSPLSQPRTSALISGISGDIPHPHRSSSPLSASTARALDIPLRARESTGLFYPDNVGASPSKVGRAGQASAGGSDSASGAGTSSSAAGAGAGGDFVLVEREEKEWVDNVWKGVRGKGGRMG